MTDFLTLANAALAGTCVAAALAAVAFLGRPAPRRGGLPSDAPAPSDAPGAASGKVEPGCRAGPGPDNPAPVPARPEDRTPDAAPGDGATGRFGSVIRVPLTAETPAPNPEPPDAGPELDTLRRAMDATPYPVWRTGYDGAVTWHNAAYAALARKIRGRDADLAQPLLDAEDSLLRAGRKTRLSISPHKQDQKFWLDVTLIKQDDGDLFYALDANAVVDAEVAQRNFVQTLAKTFAQLPIGLAIFDRNRQLALFNPAVIDLTGLPADFLSARPTLFGFFDRLRDLRIMPEPKDYAGWRQQMADLAAAAADGRYQETWSLSSGSVYSVSGRPHPDGAVAFLIEDITAEITLTRRFRAELELGQAILDRMDEAIAVFSGDGTLLFSNEPFHALWGLDPDRSFAQFTVIDATRAWQESCAPTPVWGDLRDFVAIRENRADWWAEVALRTGHKLKCGVHPVQNGSTLVRFSPLPDNLATSAGVTAPQKVQATA